jgi:AcrR family transcriptional regulator
VTATRDAPPEKRTQILEATIRILTERGLSGLKIEDVAREAEVGKGTVYLYFQDKQALLRALVEQRTLQFYAEAEAVTTAPGAFRDRLCRLMAARFAFAEEWRGLWSAVAREASSDQTWLLDLHETYGRILLSFVETAIECGELPVGEARLTALFLSTLSLPQLPVDEGAFISHVSSIIVDGLHASAPVTA